MTRVAAVDIGTNSTRLLVADVAGDRIDDVVRRSVVTRLGEGVDASRTLQPAPIARVHKVLSGFRRESEELGVVRTLAVATSAVRDSGNGESFLAEIQSLYGFATRLLSGNEEAELTRRGVGAVDDGTLVVDIGGGSTELLLAGFRTSIDVGSVRLTERFLHSDPPSEAELATASGFVRDLLPDLDVKAAVGVAGTVTQLHELVGDLTAQAVDHELQRLAALPLSQRRRVPGLDPDRAPVIVGGAVIVREVLRRYGLEALTWSVRDLLDGVAFAAAELPPTA